MPDATGTYIGSGTYAGKPYYKIGAAYHIWYNEVAGVWKISVLLGTEGAAYWSSSSDFVDDTYTPGGTATGAATVTKL